MEEIVKYHFARIDEELAALEVPIERRTLRAATKFVKECIITSNIDPRGKWEPGEEIEFVQKRWLRIVHGYAHEWYTMRYGGRVSISRRSEFRAVVLIANTPFQLSVPTTVSQPEVHGKTAVISFPSRVLHDETLLAWVMDAPNFENYSAEEIDRAKRNCFKIANLVRGISCKLTGADVTDDDARAVLAGIRLHLYSAAELIARDGEEGRLSRAQWELQMACESAYKGVLQQHTKKFPKHHDLLELNVLAKPHIGRVPKEWLLELPRWNESANLRYGLGDEIPTIFGVIRWYTLALKIIDGVLAGLKGFKLSDASITVRMAPWIRPYGDNEGWDPGDI